MNKLQQLFQSKAFLKKVSDRFGLVFLYIVLIALSFVFLFPILTMLSQSFMTVEDIVAPDILWVPSNFSINNFKVAIFVMDYWNALINSIWVSGLFAVVQTSVSALTGYAFARYNFKGKRILFTALILSFILPVQLLTAAHQIIFTSLGDFLGMSFYGSILPQMIMLIFGQGINSAILIIIFQSFFAKIPKDLYEAANIDGANTMQIFWHITVKISLAIMFVVFLFSFVWNWNEDFVTNVFLADGVDLLTGKLGQFQTLFGSTAGGNDRISEAFESAATILSIAPLLLIYIFTQRQFVEGIESVGITGQ